MRIERLSLKNKQKMSYLLQNNTKTAVLEKEDDSGNTKYIEIDGEMVPVETGTYEIGQGEESEQGEATDNIVEFEGNISFSGGETDLREYGVDSSDYDAILVMPKGALPLTETSLIWYQSEPKYLDGRLVFGDDENVTDDEGNGITAQTSVVDTTTADFHVSKVIPSLGVCRYLLKAVIH